MHFGKTINRVLVFAAVAVLSISSCKRDKEPVYFISPLEGANVVDGEVVVLKTDAEPGSFDLIKYLVDDRFVASRKDTQAVRFPTTGLPFGGRLVTAVIFTGTDSAVITTNIQLLPSKAPVKYSYSVVNVYPHDTTSFIEGLEYHDGYLYESDGGTIESGLGQSSLRLVELKTGKVLKKVDIDKYFAEGITVVGNKIIQLTYREGLGFVYDKNTFKKIAEFPYTAGREGWGLAFDGNQILNTDGTNNIYFLNKDSFQKERTLEVYDNSGPVDQLNELEYIDGKIYANIWQKDIIVIIDPKTGAVEGTIDLTGLLPGSDHVEGLTDVLNGIAWDAAGKRLFVTGKKWNKLFEIKVNRNLQ